MKQIMTIVAMCLMLSATQAQGVQQAVAEKIVEQCRGTITRSGELNYVAATVPSYYDEDLVKMSVAVIVRKYSNVNVQQTWRRTEEGSIQLFLKIDDVFMIIDYRDRWKAILFVW